MSLDRKIILYITILSPKKAHVLYRYNTRTVIWAGDAMHGESSVFSKGILRRKVFMEGGRKPARITLACIQYGYIYIISFRRVTRHKHTTNASCVPLLCVGHASFSSFCLPPTGQKQQIASIFSRDYCREVFVFCVSRFYLPSLQNAHKFSSKPSVDHLTAARRPTGSPGVHRATAFP